MALSDPEQAADAAPTDQQPAAMPRRRRWRWLWLVVLCAGLLGLLVGVGVVLRGRSLESSATADVVGRPTFVIGAAASPIPSPTASPGVAESVTAADYVVQSGDTLRSIAQDVYGDANQWPRIYDANRELIGPDPDALQAGMRLRTP